MISRPTRSTARARLRWRPTPTERSPRSYALSKFEAKPGMKDSRGQEIDHDFTERTTFVVTPDQQDPGDPVVSRRQDQPRGARREIAGRGAAVRRHEVQALNARAKRAYASLQWNERQRVVGVHRDHQLVRAGVVAHRRRRSGCSARSAPPAGPGESARRRRSARCSRTSCRRA